MLQVGLYVYQPPCGREALLGTPRDVVALARASRRCGLFVTAPQQPDASALVAGSAVLYRVNGGPAWTLVARDCLPRRPLHLAISLFTDVAASDDHAVALLNPGPHFAVPPPSADELAAAVAERRGGGAHASNEDGASEALLELRLPSPRALCELGPGAEEWMAQREAAAAPAEPEGEEECCDDDAAAPAVGQNEAPGDDAAMHIAACNAPRAAPDDAGGAADNEGGARTAQHQLMTSTSLTALLLAAAAAWVSQRRHCRPATMTLACNLR